MNHPKPKLRPSAWSLLGLVCLAACNSNYVARQDLVGAHTEPIESVTPRSSLGKFEFRFENGDHRINRMTLLREGDGSSLTAAFLDDSPDDDRWSFSARFVPIPGIDVITATGRCSNDDPDEDDFNQCRPIQVPEMFALGHRVALAGFHFQLSNGRVPTGDIDLEVFELAVVTTETGTVTLTFPDLEIFDPPDFVWELQFQLVPEDMVDVHQVELEIPESGSRSFEVFGEPDRRVLSSFRIKLAPPGGGADARMHLLAFGIDLARGEFTFQDDDRNEPLTADITYLVLR